MKSLLLAVYFASFSLTSLAVYADTAKPGKTSTKSAKITNAALFVIPTMSGTTKTMAIVDGAIRVTSPSTTVRVASK